MVSTEDEDVLLGALKELQYVQTVIDLQSETEELQMEVNRLKEELEDEKKANVVEATKLSDSLDLICKVEGYIQQPADVLNKARLFDEGLAKDRVIAVKVIPVLVDFNYKIEEILLNMRGFFEELEVQGLVPLDQMPNLSINTKELPMLQGWETGIVGQTPTPTKPAQPQASEQAKEATEV